MVKLVFLQGENHILAPGSQAVVLREQAGVNAGEVVTIIKYRHERYLVLVNAVRQKIWLPSSAIASSGRKPWSFA